MEPGKVWQVSSPRLHQPSLSSARWRKPTLLTTQSRLGRLVPISGLLSSCVATLFRISGALSRWTCGWSLAPRRSMSRAQVLRATFAASITGPLPSGVDGRWILKLRLLLQRRASICPGGHWTTVTQPFLRQDRASPVLRMRLQLNLARMGRHLSIFRLLKLLSWAYSQTRTARAGNSRCTRQKWR